MRAKTRATNILNHIKNSNREVTQAEFIRTSNRAPKSNTDIVIVSAVRTPIGKAKRGSFKDTHWTDLLATALKACVDRSGVPKSHIEDIQVGTVLPNGGGATQARMAQFLADIDYKTALTTTNRQCSSGLQAFANIAGEISTGAIACGIAAGVESMSHHNMMSSVGSLNEKVFQNDTAKDCLLPMGQTSENVAEKYGITREEQDKFGLESQRRAVKAQREGLFDDEIVPVKTTFVKKDESRVTITVTKDDGPRESSLAGLQKLRPAFKKNGTTTAGNSSQVSDGAAAVMVMTRELANKLGVKILGSFVSYAVAGVPPAIMGVGPAAAIPKALEKAGLSVSDIDVFEVNEAFASQCVYCAKKLKIPFDKLNPLGGAIALGHPLGCTGARQISTLLHQLRRTGGKYGVVSMCIGTGMGAAGVFKAE